MKDLKIWVIADGCCSLEPALGDEFCHPNYPQAAKGVNKIDKS